MGRFHRHLLVLLLGLAAALALAACGEGGDAELLPGATASEISSNLKEVRRLADEEDCIGAQDAALAVSDQIDALGGVDQKLKTALREGAARLNEVVAACEEEEPEASEEETMPSLSTEPEEVEEKGQKKPKQEEKEPPGQEKKAEKEAEKEEKEAEKTEPSEEPPTTPVEMPAETPGKGTPPGGIAPGTEAGAE